MSCKQSEAELKQTGGICLMNEELRYKDTVKEAIAIALVDLMGTRPLDQISVKDIVLRAGVGRSSFYRNFGRREDILLLCIDHMLQLPPKAAPYSNEWAVFAFAFIMDCLGQQLFAGSAFPKNQNTGIGFGSHLSEFLNAL